MKKKYKYINYKDNIADVISQYPETVEVFLAFGLHCVGCFANAFDTIESGCVVHGMGKKESEELLDEVNYVVEQRLPDSKNVAV
ncbi:disulfide oxidoreductase [candidate division WWE3 bacterium CG10_big_fil_rev_8_21_14_0_10_32_10]|uniref:Disulfide oxidoreductase n=1 Tax=candidate division WWE3 bacterium CG10_big_fil_rev_8_21_14_0_10_32_10 TaxID=1975090 RepID=A0A2H0RBG5_UNCKA|nr:MAG: disulfide oxidoreductase [candidate division WWE3 bacterium CG10_big_fil_rev_8_21_14_0_10_32_10]